MTEQERVGKLKLASARAYQARIDLQDTLIALVEAQEYTRARETLLLLDACASLERNVDASLAGVQP